MTVSLPLSAACVLLALLLYVVCTEGAPTTGETQVGPDPADFEEAVGNPVKIDQDFGSGDSSLHVSLPLSERAIRPPNVVTTWVLQEVSDGTYACPSTIVHRGYARFPQNTGPIVVGHGKIIQDGQRCRSQGLNRRLELYESQYYEFDPMPQLNSSFVGQAPELPDNLKLILQSSGKNVNALANNVQSGNDFLFGYDTVSRLCATGPAIFNDLTTVFIMKRGRPFMLSDLDMTFEAGSLYMLIVPKFKGVFCAYVDQNNLQENPSPEMDDEEDGNGDGSGNGDDTVTPMPTFSEEVPISTLPPSPIASVSFVVDPAPSLNPSASTSPEVTPSMMSTPMPSAPEEDSGDESGETSGPTVTPGLGTSSDPQPSEPDESVAASPTAEPEGPEMTASANVSPTETPSADSGDPTEGGDDGAVTSPEDDGAVCFPADAQVVRSDGTVLAMSDLTVGTHVRTGAMQTSTVFGFSHRELRRKFEFVRLITDDGVLETTAGHFVHTSEGLLPAAKMAKGMDLIREDGVKSRVKSVSTVWKTGLFAPHTLDGNIVVNGFQASTFTTAVRSTTASALLSPLRALSLVVNWSLAQFYQNDSQRYNCVNVDVVSFVLDRLNMRERAPWQNVLPRS